MATAACIPYNDQNAFEKVNWRFKCDFCSNTFHTEHSFNTHILEHFEKRNCLNCNKLLLRIGSKWYELHIDDPQIIKIEPNARPIDSMVEVKIEEDIPEMNTSNDSTKNAHIDDESVLFDYPCSNTDDSGDDQKEKQYKPKRIRKTKIKHSGEIEAKSPETRQLKNKGKLPRIKCQICDRIILKYNFEKHLQKIHVPNVIMSREKINCETCGKSFANNGNLKIHQAIHSGTKRFVCSYCGTSFRQLYHLTEHMNAHTGEKPYHCEICDKRFGRLHILRAHQRIHTGEKPHKCGIDGCDKAYAYDIDLKRHKYSAHGIYTKKHICSFCSKVFPENKLLKKHLDSHSAGNIRRIVSQSLNESL